MKTQWFYQLALISLLTAAVGCESDDFQAGDTVVSHDAMPSHDGSAPHEDSGLGDATPVEYFAIEGRILFDANVGCVPTDPLADCRGRMIWGIWPKPPTEADAGLPIFLGEIPEGGHGSTFSAINVPIAPQMYMVAFMDDNNTITADTLPMPDVGDPIHMDLEPFTATQGATVLQEITFFVRMP